MTAPDLSTANVVAGKIGSALDGMGAFLNAMFCPQAPVCLLATDTRWTCSLSWMLAAFSLTAGCSRHPTETAVDPAAQQASSHVAFSADDVATPNALAELGAKYGVTIVVKSVPFRVEHRTDVITAREPSPDSVLGCTRLLEFELSLYPNDLLRKAGLRSIVVCEGLARNDSPEAIILTSTSGRIYIDAAYAARNDGYIRLGVHHELFHMIDEADDGSLWDGSWSSLNDKGFVYLPSICDRSEAGESVVWLRYAGFPGFVSGYSMSAVYEDKAEVFASMMVEPVHIADRVTQDAIVKRKVEYIAELVRKFCPGMDDRFWDRVRTDRQALERNRPLAGKLPRALTVFLSQYIGERAVGNTGQSPVFCLDDFERLDTVIAPNEVDRLAMHSTAAGSTPAHSVGALSNGQVVLYMMNCVIAQQAVAPDLVAEISRRRGVDVPLSLDYAFVVGCDDDSGAIYIQLRDGKRRGGTEE